jgi:hypothetical protein
MKAFVTTICIGILSLLHINEQQKFDDFCNKFVSGYKALNMPQLELSYVAGLEHIGSVDAVQKQLEFFRSVQTELAKYKPEQLSPSQKTDYALIDYESKLNMERLVLEQDWLKHKPTQISANGIITVPNGKVWYAYLLKRWVNADVTPDQIYQFGLTEVSRVQKHIEAIRVQTGLS